MAPLLPTAPTPATAPEDAGPGPRAADLDAMRDAAADVALVAVLRAKPAEEPVPTSIWWLVAEALRSSVAYRRLLASHALGEAEEALVEARLLTDAAVLELVDATGAALEVSPRPDVHDRYGETPGFGLQLSVLSLARLLVSRRVTPPTRLAAALGAHQQALGRVEAQAQLPSASIASGTPSAASTAAATRSKVAAERR